MWMKPRVGCTLCAGIAPSTFQMTDDYGRWVFNQEGEDEETIIVL